MNPQTTGWLLHHNKYVTVRAFIYGIGVGFATALLVWGFI